MLFQVLLLPLWVTTTYFKLLRLKTSLVILNSTFSPISHIQCIRPEYNPPPLTCCPFFPKSPSFLAWFIITVFYLMSINIIFLHIYSQHSSQSNPYRTKAGLDHSCCYNSSGFQPQSKEIPSSYKDLQSPSTLWSHYLFVLISHDY